MTELETIRAALQAGLRTSDESTGALMLAGLVALELVAEDSARLDWQFRDTMNRKVYIRDYEEGKYTYICMGHRADSPRGAMDLAREATAATEARLRARALVPMDQQPEGRP